MIVQNWWWLSVVHHKLGRMNHVKFGGLQKIRAGYMDGWLSVEDEVMKKYIRDFTLGSFTVGIFSPFFNHFSIIFHFILFPFFLKVETQNERKMNVKWNPNVTFAKMDSKNYHFHLFWQCAWREKCIFASFSIISVPGVSR